MSSASLGAVYPSPLAFLQYDFAYNKSTFVGQISLSLLFLQVLQKGYQESGTMDSNL